MRNNNLKNPKKPISSQNKNRSNSFNQYGIKPPNKLNSFQSFNRNNKLPTKNNSKPKKSSTSNNFFRNKNKKLINNEFSPINNINKNNNNNKINLEKIFNIKGRILKDEKKPEILPRINNNNFNFFNQAKKNKNSKNENNKKNGPIILKTNNKNTDFLSKNNKNQKKIKLRANSAIPSHSNLNEFFSYCSNGLVNVGATCYMNATLQCLAHVENLTKHLLKSKIIPLNKARYKLANAYIEVLKNLWLRPDIKYYSPNNFKNLISEMNPLFEGIQANDSKDLILFLMETLHNELNKINNNIANMSNNFINQYDYQITFNNFCKFFSKNYNSVISHLFYGMYNSMMQCLNCKIITNNIQCFNILIFPLEEVRKFKNNIQNIVNIYECFEYYQKDDIMMGQNQIYCNNCKIMANSINKSKLIICPNVLVIILNRGKGLQFDVKLNFDEYLNIKNFIFYEQSPSFYELIGIVTHFGPSSMSGHFIAFCKSFVDQKWYKYNDAQVNISTFEEARITGVPYILFYSYIKS